MKLSEAIKILGNHGTELRRIAEKEDWQITHPISDAVNTVLEAYKKGLL